MNDKTECVMGIHTPGFYIKCYFFSSKILTAREHTVPIKAARMIKGRRSVIELVCNNRFKADTVKVDMNIPIPIMAEYAVAAMDDFERGTSCPRCMEKKLRE